ncbi:MAG: 3-dehydroquinate synthase [Anaerolineaceae bacterium]|nr:3-dehydroquinate synthase [Anaerolineaceae bacterium]
MIFLYGPSGSGKSTVGKLLAEYLDKVFYDLDEEIGLAAGEPIAEIFEQQGEAAFREIESAELENILVRQEGVVALGGGALLDPRNHARVNARGPVLCLKASAETMLTRLKNDHFVRPLLSEGGDAGFEKYLAVRAEHYASFPMVLDTTDCSPEDAAWQAQVQLGMFHISGMGQGYDVRVQSGILQSLDQVSQQLELSGSMALVSDSNVAGLYADNTARSLGKFGYPVYPLVIPAGESHKTLETVKQTWDAFARNKLDRGSTVVALGGGVVGDLAGFAAATYLRGVRWVNFPTSLLAMVDASLGGKTGANLEQGKNLIGAFHAPRLVLADTDTLDTLPEDELLNGLGEVVKHGVIGDAALFSLCARGLNDVKKNLNEIIRRAIAVKVKIIEADPYERNLRQVLNLGHTVGHALEKASNFLLKHGEAVSIGMVAEASLAERINLAEAGLAQEIRGALTALGLPVDIPPDLDWDVVVGAMKMDKKRVNGKMRFALPVRIGCVQPGIEIKDLDKSMFVSSL